MSITPAPPPAAAAPYPAAAGRSRDRRGEAIGRGGDIARVNPVAATAAGRGAPRSPVCRSSAVPRRTRRFRADTLICDIDQVVIRFDPAVPQEIERRHGLAAGSLLDTLVEWPTARLATIGVLAEQTWLRYARQTLPPPAVDEWLAYPGDLNQPVIELLGSATRAGLRLCLLANGTGRLRDRLAHHQLAGFAAHVFLSAEIGYAKPDPRAWQHVLNHIGAPPAHTISVDHNPSWVDTSRQLGMRGHRYVDATQLREELARAGVTV